MAARAMFMDELQSVRALRYAWAEDGTVMLTLDCHVPGSGSEGLTYQQLLSELRALCPWQMSSPVVIGLEHALAEVVTVYHEFEGSASHSDSLLLVCTPPEEYFEAKAA